MTLPRHAEEPALLTWNDVVRGAPSIIGFAALCGRAIAAPERDVELTPVALAILYAARDRASIEIKATRNAYNSAERLLAVHVETAPEQWLAFRSRLDPRFTLAALDGFRQLCRAGLVMHHHGPDFSLTHAGLAMAATIDKSAVESLLAMAVEIDFGDEPGR
jgi:hypothetical protein